ncbi:O-antigen/teichoic acid export membrane protein [Hephaestia caeni]|uniref:O-antigen/teichoic acid export membrane protein n=1 Tax=Hephaestia caeni TaxID=645617 RepID=A0A397NKY2_9SPHN|nr:polysaccharide biosynthesis C-terminal domain-containing protein [Hephaestia caeni]RIA35355.1 O-antigen/teichoic acid export membrane protein [Hephaestia caeni]
MVTKEAFARLMRTDALQSVFAFLIKGGAGVANYIFFALAARLAGPSAFGAFSILFSAAMIIGLAGAFGQQTFLLKEIPRTRAQGLQGEEAGAYRFALLSSGIASLLGCFVFAGVSLLLPQRIPAMAIAAGATLCFLYSMSQVTVAAMRVQDRLQLAMGTRDVLWRLLSIAALSIVGLFLRPGSTVLIGVLAAMLLPITILHLGLIRKGFPMSLRDPRIVVLARPWLRMSWGLMLISVIAGADIYFYTLVIGYLVPAEEAGALFAAMKSVELLSLFLISVTLVITPELSHLLATGDREALQQKCKQAIIIQSLPTIGVSLVIIAAAPLFMWLFNPAYVAQAGVLRILALAMIVSALTGAGGMLMQLSGLHWRQVVYQGLSLLLGVVSMPFLVNVFGLMGAALSFLIAKLVWNVLAAYTIDRHLGVDPSILGLLRRREKGRQNHNPSGD